EQVTRAVAGSRVPTVVAIGHEVDISLAELASDKRASTPSNAAQLLVPDKAQMLRELPQIKKQLAAILTQITVTQTQYTKEAAKRLNEHADRILNTETQRL